MSYKIITVSRMFGTGGRAIDRALADRLQISYYGNDVIQMVADETGMHPEFVAERGEHAPFIILHQIRAERQMTSIKATYRTVICLHLCSLYFQFSPISPKNDKVPVKALTNC